MLIVMKTMGDRIREERLRLGLNPTELARKIGTSRQNIYRWQDGSGNPSEANLQALAGVFGRSVRWLRDGELAEFDIDENELVSLYELVKARSSSRGVSLSPVQELRMALALYHFSKRGIDITERDVDLAIDGAISA